MAAQKALAQAIVAFLKDEGAKASPLTEKQLTGAVNTISDVFGLRNTTPYTGQPLLDIFAAKTGLSTTASTSSSASETANASAPPSEEALPSYASTMKTPAASSASPSPTPSASENELGESYKVKGNDAFKEGDYRRAITLYTKAIAACPSNPAFYSNRAAAYLKLGQNTFAIRDCDKALEKDSTFFKAQARKGEALLADGKLEDALICYTKASALQPDQDRYKASIQEIENQIAKRNSSESFSRSASASSTSAAPPAAAAGAPDLSGILGTLSSNPELMNMVGGLLQSPGMGDMLRNLTGGAGGAAAPPASASSDSDTRSAPAPSSTAQAPPLAMPDLSAMLSGLSGGASSGSGDAGAEGAPMPDLSALLGGLTGGGAGGDGAGGAGGVDFGAMMSMASSFMATQNAGAAPTGDATTTPTASTTTRGDDTDTSTTDAAAPPTMDMSAMMNMASQFLGGMQQQQPQEGGEGDDAAPQQMPDLSALLGSLMGGVPPANPEADEQPE